MFTDVQRKQIEELVELESGLRPRELDFVEDLSQLDPQKSTLTQKQSDWLDVIHARLVRGEG